MGHTRRTWRWRQCCGTARSSGWKPRKTESPWPSPGRCASARARRRRNAHNTKDREKGKYYRRMWEAAIQHEADMVSITSYNEWGEGTQIEPAVRKTGYEDPGDDPNSYLQLTADYADELRRRRREQREEREEL